ncbi:MAG: hypothetical protein ACI9J3_004173 [Parvicellaceae bacterium]|jgi:hypothetical protein
MQNNTISINKVIAGFLLIGSVHWLSQSFGVFISIPMGLLIWHHPDVWSIIPQLLFEVILIFFVLRNATKREFESKSKLIILAAVTAGLYLASLFSPQLGVDPFDYCGNAWMSGEADKLLAQRYELQNIMVYVEMVVVALSIILFTIFFTKTTPNKT